VAKPLVSSREVEKVEGFIIQIIFENENKRSSSRETDIINTIICTERIGRCMKGELVRRFENRRSRIQVSRGIFVRIKKGI